MKENDASENPPLYSEREGVGVGQSLDELSKEAAGVLSETELHTVRNFAAGLLNGQLNDQLQSGCEMNLEQLRKITPLNEVQRFHLGYFTTPEGKADLERLGISTDKPDEIGPALDDVATVNATVSSKERKQIAANSNRWRKSQMAGLLLQPPEKDADWEESESRKVNYDQSVLLNKITALSQYRNFYRQVRKSLRTQETSKLVEAQMAVLNIYRGRVNEMMAGYYSAAISLASQLQRQPDNAGSDHLTKLVELLPVLKTAFSQQREAEVFDLEEFRDRFAMRLDFIRNGATWQPGAGYTPISPELAELAETIKRQSPTATNEISARVSPDVMKKIDETLFNAEQLKEFAETILAEWGLLSSHQSDYDEADKRQGFAADGKWQVILRPEKDNLAISGAKRVFWISDRFLRNLSAGGPPSGVLPALAHELVHILQAEYDYKSAEQFPLAKVKGRRTTVMREVGTVYEERRMQSFFGRNRNPNLHYLEALREKLAGGNKLQVARAFYNSLKAGQKLDDKADAEARELAVDRSLRLSLDDGFNTEPLSYIERELIIRALEKLPEGRAINFMIAGTSFNFRDLNVLRHYGLIDLPKDTPPEPAEEVWRVFKEKYLPDLV